MPTVSDLRKKRPAGAASSSTSKKGGGGGGARPTVSVPEPLPAAYRGLDTLGFVVIPDVVPVAECEAAVESINAWFRDIGCTKLTFDAVAPPDARDKHDLAAWLDQNNRPPSMHGGLIQGYRAPYIPGVRAVRYHPRVADHFAALWGTQRLLAAPDGICVIPPWERTGARPPRDTRPSSQRAACRIIGEWHHLDQNPSKTKRISVQGHVTLRDVTADDATLCVLAGSHRYVENGDFARAFPATVAKPSEDWVKLTDEQVCWFASRPGVEEVFIDARAGSLTLWDSRTVHCIGRPRAEPRAVPRWRYVVYVCMRPCAAFTRSDTEKLMDAVGNRRTTNHTGLRLFPRDPVRYATRKESSFDLRTYGESFTVTRRVANLMGIKPYMDSTDEYLVRMWARCDARGELVTSHPTSEVIHRDNEAYTERNGGGDEDDAGDAGDDDATTSDVDAANYMFSDDDDDTPETEDDGKTPKNKKSRRQDEKAPDGGAAGDAKEFGVFGDPNGPLYTTDLADKLLQKKKPAEPPQPPAAPKRSEFVFEDDEFNDDAIVL